MSKKYTSKEHKNKNKIRKIIKFVSVFALTVSAVCIQHFLTERDQLLWAFEVSNVLVK